MRNYTKNEAVSQTGKNYSVYTYTATDGSDVFTQDSVGKGAPKVKIAHDNGIGLKIYELTELTRYIVPTGPKRPRKLKEVNKDSIVREVVESDEKKTILHYEDGTSIVASGGRPKYHNEDGSKLVKIVSYTVGKRKGRSKVDTEIVVVKENPRIEYVYDDMVEIKTEGRRGAPPAFKDGKKLTKIVKYILGKKEKPVYLEGEEPPKPTMAELGWLVGQKVTLKGSSKVAIVASVRDDYVGIQYPNDKFIDTFPVNRLVKVG